MKPLLVIVRFTYCEWDNWQGGSGDVFEKTKAVSLYHNTPCHLIKDHVLNILNEEEYFGSHSDKKLSSKNIISITIN